MKLKLALICTLGLAAGQALACYTVYDGTGRVLYQDAEAPVDMSQPLGDTLPRQFGTGVHMQFEQGADCRPMSLAVLPKLSAAAPNTAMLGAGRGTRVMGGPPGATPARAPAPSTSPLLTDRQTAEAMRLPYTQLEGGIVMVPAQAAANAVRPAVNVVPAQDSGVLPARSSLAEQSPRNESATAGQRSPVVNMVERPPGTPPTR